MKNFSLHKKTACGKMQSSRMIVVLDSFEVMVAGRQIKLRRTWMMVLRTYGCCHVGRYRVWRIGSCSGLVATCMIVRWWFIRTLKGSGFISTISLTIYAPGSLIRVMYRGNGNLRDLTKQ